MKKLFLLLAAMCFAGSICAVETITYVFKSKSWAAKVGTEDANWISGKDGAAIENNGVKVTTNDAYNGANATSPVSFTNIKQIVVTYNTNKSAGAGTLEVQVGTNTAKTNNLQYSGTGDGRSANFTSIFDYSSSPESGDVKLTVNTTTNSIYVVSVTITYNYNPSEPVIYVNDVDLGTLKLEFGDTYNKDVDVTVTSANLTKAITISLPAHITADETSLPAAGGTLHLHVAAPAGLFSEVVTLSSGSVVKEIEISGKIKQYIALPGTPATMTGVSNYYASTVEGVEAIRIGNSTSTGEMTITVPADAGVLHIYAAAWKDEPGNILISASPNVISISKLSLVADPGIAGGAYTYELDATTPTPYRIDIPLTNVTSEATITLTSATGTGNTKRCVIWGATTEEAIPSVLDITPTDCKAVKTIENGQLVIIRAGHRYNALGAMIQ